MFTLAKKEISQFFGSLTGYITIAAFLLLCGLLLFVVPSNSVFDFNMLDYGYATMEKFFKLAPWVLLLLIPPITMRSFSDEFKSGTFELLKTKPLTNVQIIGGKFLGALFIVVIALLPTLVYLLALKMMSNESGLDSGELIGAYLGLLFIAAVFVAIGICCSSFTSNAVIAFMMSIAVCFLFYFLFTGISKVPVFKGGADYYIESLGMDFHYRSISRGVLDTRDIFYFLVSLFLFFIITFRNLVKR